MCPAALLYVHVVAHGGGQCRSTALTCGTSCPRQCLPVAMTRPTVSRGRPPTQHMTAGQVSLCRPPFLKLLFLMACSPRRAARRACGTPSQDNGLVSARLLRLVIRNCFLSWPMPVGPPNLHLTPRPPPPTPHLRPLPPPRNLTLHSRSRCLSPALLRGSASGPGGFRGRPGGSLRPPRR